MEWTEMTAVQKALTVSELISGLLFWTLFLLSSFDILEAILAELSLMLVNCACRMFTARTKVLKIAWGCLAVISCLLLVVYLLLSLS